MALKLSKSQIAEKTERSAALAATHEALEQAISEYNDAAEALRAPVDAALEAFNEALFDARNWAEELGGDLRNEFSEKSEKWQEGERGQAADQWLEQWEQYQPDAAEIDWPEPLEVPDGDNGDELDGIPDEPQ